MILLTLLIQLPSLALAYEWDTRQGFQGWSFYNVDSIRFSAGGAIISKKTNNGDFAISVLTGIARSECLVKVHFRTQLKSSLVSCILLAGDQVVASRAKFLYSGRSWKGEVFNFSGAHLSEHFDRVMLSFSHCDSIEIRDLAVTGPSFSEFFALQGLRAYNVNGLSPFTLYGYPVNLWLYVFIIISIAGIMLFHSATRKKRVAFLAFVIFLASYVALDTREAWEEFKIMENTYEDYLSAPPGEKRYQWHDNLVEFADLIQHTVQPGEDSSNFFGEDSRYLYMRYLLYPIKLVQARETLARANIFSESEHVLLDGHNLTVDGRVLATGGKGVAYDSHSFLYLLP